jgi:hypothetical protein
VFFLNHAVTAVTDESDFGQLRFQGFLSASGEIGARERSAGRMTQPRVPASPKQRYAVIYIATDAGKTKQYPRRLVPKLARNLGGPRMSALPTSKPEDISNLLAMDEEFAALDIVKRNVIEKDWRGT